MGRRQRRFLDTGTTTDQIGFTETAGLFTAGAQVALDDVWRLGFARRLPERARCRRQPARRATARSGKAAWR